MWQAETICILQLLDKHKQTKINPREKRAVAMDFAHVIFKHSPYSSCRDIISNLSACADQEGRGGGGSLNFLYSHILKLPKKALDLSEKNFWIRACNGDG